MHNKNHQAIKSYFDQPFRKLSQPEYKTANQWESKSHFQSRSIDVYITRKSIKSRIDKYILSILRCCGHNILRYEIRPFSGNFRWLNRFNTLKNLHPFFPHLLCNLLIQLKKGICSFIHIVKLATATFGYISTSFQSFSLPHICQDFHTWTF